jgi:hypothetical protein
MATLLDGTTVCRFCTTEGQGDLCSRHATLVQRSRFERCAACGQAFTLDQWEDRHSGPDGEDLHAGCCTHCEPIPYEVVGYVVLDLNHPDLSVTFDDADEAREYAALHGCRPPVPVVDLDLYSILKEVG